MNERRPNFSAGRIALANSLLGGTMDIAEFSRELRELEEVERAYDETEHARTVARHEAATTAALGQITGLLDRLGTTVDEVLEGAKRQTDAISGLKAHVEHKLRGGKLDG